MPIKTLAKNLGVPVVGHFRLGLQVESKTPGVMRPMAVDYFVYRPTALLARAERFREEAAKAQERRAPALLLEACAAVAEKEAHAAVAAFTEAHGAQPRELVVRFISEDLDATFAHWLTLWGGRRLLCKGDGEHVVWRGIEEDSGVDAEGRMVCSGPDTCPLSMSRANKDGVPGCGPSGSLRFTLGSLAGIHSLELGSWRAVRRALAGLEGLRASVGGLCGYDVRLSLRPEQQTGRDGKTRTVQVVDMLPTVGMADARRLAAQGGALAASVVIEEDAAAAEVAEPVDPDFALPEDAEPQPTWWELDQEVQEALARVSAAKRGALVKGMAGGNLSRDGVLKACRG